MEKKEQKLLLGIADCMFKAIMLKKENRDYLKELIHYITNIPLSDLENIIIENSEYIVENKKDKKMRSDIIVSIGNKTINIEANKYYYTGLFEKNDAYFYKLETSRYNETEEYISGKNCIQINFDNFYYFEKEKEISKFVYKESETNEEYKNSDIKYYVNLAYIKDTCYNKEVNKLSRFERLCLLLVSETSEFANKVAGEDDMMKKISDNLDTLSKDKKMIGLYNKEIQDEKIINTVKKAGIKEGIEKGIEQGIEKGINQGIEQEKIEIAKNMLKKEMDIKTIYEITGLTKEELEKLN